MATPGPVQFNGALARFAPRWQPPAWVRLVNKVCAKLHSPVDLKLRFDHHVDMVSLEQVANIELLLNGLLDRNVSGDAVELGCYTGSTAVVMGNVLQERNAGRTFHVYDRFDIALDPAANVRERFQKKIGTAGLPMPRMHVGDLFDTVPAELPDDIAFAHIDLGIGAGKDVHTRLITHALTSVYPRLSQGAVVLLMDYHDAERTVDGNDSNPGVKVATDRFLTDKPEQIKLLYGGACSHAYFMKA